MTTTQPATHLEREVASQPEAWRTVVGRLPGLAEPCRRPARASPSSGAAPRCSSPRRTPPCASRPATASPTPGPRASTGSGGATTGCWRSPGPAPRRRCSAARRPARRAAPHGRHRRPAHPRRRPRRTDRAGRGRRAVGGPDPFRHSHARPAARLARPRPRAGVRGRRERAGPRCAVAAGRRPDRRPDRLPRPRVDRRPGPRGGAEAARGGAGVDRELPRHGVPARTDLDRHRRSPDLGAREVPPGLADDVRATGADFEHSTLDPMADLVRVHLLCLARAAAAGLDPDSPRHLSRSIILDR